MNYTVSDIKKMYEGRYADIEFYKFRWGQKIIYTDYIEYIEDVSDDAPVEDFELMDEERYDFTVELYNYVMKEISPINYEKLRYRYRTEGEKWLKDAARCIVEAFAPCEVSNQLIRRAAKLLYLELKNIVS